MTNFRLTIEYDGTAYSGWQVQPNGITIQYLIERAAKRMLGHSVCLTASGRTDAGVHALGQVANFNTDRDVAPAKLVAGLNGLLPPDISVIGCSQVPDQFDSRRSAVSKTYLYRIFNRPERSPFEINRAWHLWYKFDISVMKEVLDMVSGRHDFAGFMASDGCSKTTDRTITEAEVKRNGDYIEILLSADGFLKFMVRNIVGTAVEIGRGRMTIDDIRRVLESGDRTLAGPTAPACGLYLLSVDYPEKFD